MATRGKAKQARARSNKSPARARGNGSTLTEALDNMTAVDTTRGNKGQEIPKRTRGRVYTEAIGEAICEGLADGHSLKHIVEAHKDMPSERAIRRWVRDENHDLNRSQSRNYARAREQGLEKLGDDVLELADSANPDNYNAIRLQIDARKWYLSKLMPKVYGERQAVDLSAKVETTATMPSDVDLARLLTAAMAEAKVIEHHMPLIAHSKDSGA